MVSRPGAVGEGNPQTTGYTDFWVDIFFSLKILFHCLMTSVLFNRKPAMIHIIVPYIWYIFFSLAFSNNLTVTCLNLVIFVFILLWVYWTSWSHSLIGFFGFFQIWEIFSHYFFTYFFHNSLSLLSFGIPLTYMLDF